MTKSLNYVKIVFSSIMFKKISNDSLRTFYITSADWESVVSSGSAEEAASKSLNEAFDVLGSELNLSPAIICVDMTNFSLNFGTDHAKVFETSAVLADIGKHNLSKKFKNISK